MMTCIYIPLITYNYIYIYIYTFNYVQPLNVFEVRVIWSTIDELNRVLSAVVK